MNVAQGVDDFHEKSEHLDPWLGISFFEHLPDERVKSAVLLGLMDTVINAKPDPMKLYGYNGLTRKN